MKTKNIFVDVVIGVSFGDEGKGKITHHLASGKGGKNYTHVMRTSGGNNAGHTIYHNGKKFATHMIPCGVFHGIKSVIGNGCVINVEKLRKEVKMLEEGGVTVMPLLKIANNAHIITQSHVEEEMSESSVGTTKTGNGPAYRDKYARVGVRAETALIGTEFEACLVDLYEELYGDPLNPIRVLIEGAQGFYLDIDWGDYPYVTSSHCGVGGVMLNGFNHKHIDTVYGSAKCYETYVGAKEFEDKTDPVLPKIREIGGEYGVTTGRPRQVGYLNIDRLIKACEINGVDTLILNKVDVLRTVNCWKTVRGMDIKNSVVTEHKDEESFKRYVEDRLSSVNVVWSDSPERI